MGANSITLMSAFLVALRNAGVVDRVAQDAMRLPDMFTGRVGAFSSIAASTIAEGAAKKLKYVWLTMLTSRRSRRPRRLS